MKSRRVLSPILASLLLALTAGGARAVETSVNGFLRCNPSGQAGAILKFTDRPDLRPTSAFSVEAWIRCDPGQTLSPYPIVLTKPVGNLLNGECSYGFVLERATGRLTFRVTTSTGTFNATASANLLDGAWHHVQGRRTTGGYVCLDVDGLQAVQVAATGTTLYAGEPLQVGGVTFTGYSGNGFVGDVDELRIWTRDHAAYNERWAKLDRGPGLVASWHFDRFYPNDAGQDEIVDSAHGWREPRQAASLGTGGPAIQSGQSLMLVDALVAASGAGPRIADAVVRLPGGRDLVARRLHGAGQPNGTRFDVVSTTSVPHLQGSLFVPGDAPIVQMVVRDSTVFCVKEVAGARRLFAVRLATPTQPEIFGDSLELPPVARLAVDPAVPSQIAFLSYDAGADMNSLGMIDVVNPAAPALVCLQEIGGSSSMGRPAGLAKRGLYVYATSSDAGLRVYRYDVFALNGQTIRTFSSLSPAYGVGDTCAVAVSGTRLCTASRNGTFRIFDLTSPTAPVQIGIGSDEWMIGEDLQVEGNFAVVAGGNGVHLVNLSTPANPVTIGHWVTDLPASGSPRVSFGGGFAGVTSGLGGYHLLQVVGTTAVGRPAEPGARTMVASPNPSRGAVAFELPATGAARSLEIFDALGRRVRAWRERANGALAGRWTWDGRDENGSAVPAGVYLARAIDAAGLVRSTRVAIVR